MRVTNVTPCVYVRYSQVLLDAGVQVADAAAGLGHRLALELEDQAQHPVRRRVLGAHVDDDAFLVALVHVVDEGVPVPTGDVVDLAGLGFTRARVRVGRVVGTRVARVARRGGHQLYARLSSGGAIWAPLYSTGMPPSG